MAGLTLRQQVVKKIITDIQTGAITSDDIIQESQLCESMSISRTPVREALIELVKDGILLKEPNKGYILNDSDQHHKLNVYDILGCLDALAASLALKHLTEDDFLKMAEYIDLIDISIKYKNYPNYCTLQDKFHQVYIDKCDNPPLIQMLMDIKLRVSRYTYFSDDSDTLFKVCAMMNQQHREILQLFRNHEHEALRTYLECNHWQTFDYNMI